MSLSTFNACIAGYQEHLFDMQLLAVHSGFWSGYYMSNKPKSLKSVLQKLYDQHELATGRQKHTHADTVDVNAFLAQEKRFKEKLAQKEVNMNEQ